MTFPIKTAALVLALASIAAPAMARDDHGWGNGHERREYDREHDGRHDRRDAYRDDRNDRRRAYRNGYGNGYGDGRHDDRRYGYGHPPIYRGYYPAPRPVYRANYYPPRPQWVRGGRYYGPGYGPTYVVQDYGYYGLRPPPRGYGWRRSDAGDFLLVALTTGIIADLVFHH